MKHLEEVLEEIKQYGAYAIRVVFGENVGCDDSDVAMLDRKIRIWWHPVGCVGESRACLYGTLDNILKWDIGDFIFKRVSNPPKDEEIKHYGLYLWGTDGTMKRVPPNLKLKDWMSQK